MTKREKLRKKLRNPSADANMQDVQTLLERFGFILARTRAAIIFLNMRNRRFSSKLLFRYTVEK